MNFTSIINSKELIEPETIRALTNLEDLEIEKAMVLWTIKNSRAVYEDMDVFENAVLVLNGITPNVAIMEGLLPTFIWYALDIMSRYAKDREFRVAVCVEIHWEISIWCCHKNIFLGDSQQFFNEFILIFDVSYMLNCCLTMNNIK